MGGTRFSQFLLALKFLTLWAGPSLRAMSFAQSSYRKERTSRFLGEGGWGCLTTSWHSGWVVDLGVGWEHNRLGKQTDALTHAGSELLCFGHFPGILSRVRRSTGHQCTCIEYRQDIVTINLWWGSGCGRGCALLAVYTLAPGFLHLSTSHVLGLIILCYGGCTVHVGFLTASLVSTH